MPAVAQLLGSQPRAFAEWVKIAAAIRRDALGVTANGKAHPASELPGAPRDTDRQHDEEMAEAMSQLSPEGRLHAQALYNELARTIAVNRARRAGRGPNRPVGLPPSSAEQGGLVAGGPIFRPSLPTATPDG